MKKQQIKDLFIQEKLKQYSEELYNSLNAIERVEFCAMLLKKMRLRSPVPKKKVLDILEAIL